MKVHRRDPAVRTMSICGQGYKWPSTIALRDDLKDVTCARCKQIAWQRHLK